MLSDSYKRKEYDDQLARQNSYNKKNTKKESKKADKSSNNASKPSQPDEFSQPEQPSQPRPEEIKDMHTLVDMYFKKRDITLQARKQYDSFLASPRKKYINWVTFIALLLFIAGVVVAMMFLS